jgi:hypothetical protein
MLHKEKRGSLLIDAMLAITIFGAVIAAFSTGILEGQRGTSTSGDRVRASHLASEGLVAIRSIRNSTDGYIQISSKTLNIDYGVNLENSGSWSITNTANTIDTKFTRVIQFSNPSANSDQRLIISTVTWDDISGETKNVSLSTYVTNWQAVPEVPSWANPTLTGSVAGPAGTTLEKIAISGDYAYVAESTLESIVIFDISDPQNPSYERSITGLGSAYDVAIRGNYLYVGTDDSSGELKVIDITNPLTASCCTEEINFPTTTLITSVSITGTGLLVAMEERSSKPEFFVLDIGEDPDLDSISEPPNLGDSATDTVYDTNSDLGGGIYAAVGTGDNSNPYAYLATDNDEGELTIVSMTGSIKTGREGPSGNMTSKSIAIVGTGAYIGIEGTDPYELYSYNLGDSISNPSAPAGASNKFDIGGDSDVSAAINDMAISSAQGYLFMATNTQIDPGSGPVNYYFRIHDIKNVHNINSISKVVYSGDITDGYHVDKGIHYDGNAQLIFMVGGNPTDGSHLIILDYN